MFQDLILQNQYPNPLPRLQCRSVLRVKPNTGVLRLAARCTRSIEVYSH